LGTSFRRAAKFKGPIRILINDLHLEYAKLTMAVTLAYARGTDKARGASTLAVTKPGQEECLAGNSLARSYKALMFVTGPIYFYYCQ
jgi:hypothetical protein